MKSLAPSLAALMLAFTMAASPAIASDDAAAQENHENHHGHDHHVAELSGVRAVHAWARATDARTAHVFVEIENASEERVTFLGGDATIAENVTLVGFQLQGGEQAYVALPEMPIPGGSEIVLAPFGLALELAGLSMALEEGETFVLELAFDIGHLDVVVEIEHANASQHSHAGHAH